MIMPCIYYLIKYKVIMNDIETSLPFEANKEMAGHLLIYCMLMIPFFFKKNKLINKSQIIAQP